MPRWPVFRDNESAPVFVAESAPGVVTLHIPPAEPIEVPVDVAEECRQALGAAIGDAQGDPL